MNNNKKRRYSIGIKKSTFANHYIIRSGLQMKIKERTNILAAIIPKDGYYRSQFI